MTTPISDEVLRSAADDVPDVRLRHVTFADVARELLAAREALRRLCDEDLRSADPDLGALYDAQTAARSLLPPPAKETR